MKGERGRGTGSPIRRWAAEARRREASPARAVRLGPGEPLAAGRLAPPGRPGPAGGWSRLGLTAGPPVR